MDAPRSGRGSLVIALAALLSYVGCKASPPPSDPSASTASSSAPGDPSTAATGDPATSAEAASGTASSDGAGPMPTGCKKDAECTLSTFAGCCTCCPRIPHAFLRTALAWHEAHCAKVDCPPCNTPCGPEPAMSGYAAECVKNACVAVPE